jgi:UDP-glucuronate decarboxylase
VQRCPDITEARTVLGWEPQTPLRDGLERTIAYFDELLTRYGEIPRAEPAFRG